MGGWQAAAHLRLRPPHLLRLLRVLQEEAHDAEGVGLPIGDAAKLDTRALRHGLELGAPRPGRERLLRVDGASLRELELLELALHEERTLARLELPLAEEDAVPAERTIGQSISHQTAIRLAIRLQLDGRRAPRLGRADLKVGTSQRAKVLLADAVRVQAAWHPELGLLPSDAEVGLPTERGATRQRGSEAAAATKRRGVSRQPSERE